MVEIEASNDSPLKVELAIATLFLLLIHVAPPSPSAMFARITTHYYLKHETDVEKINGNKVLDKVVVEILR